MDLVENENFYQSIFYRVQRTNKDIERNNNFWYKRESWQHAKKLFGYKFDAWHISKSMMIILTITSTVIGIYVEGPLLHFLFNNIWVNVFFEVIIRGLAWDVIFYLFYDKLFRAKTWQK
jgi:hypothetical protein